MAAANVRFRLVDGIDIGPKTFPLSTLVSAVKESVLADWPQKGDKEPPSSIAELKLILAGRVLDNGVTLAEARTPTSELCTMHLVVSSKPPPKGKEETPKEEAPKCTGCVLQ